ncbi:MAG: YceD family protein [Nitrospira sp.]
MSLESGGRAASLSLYSEMALPTMTVPMDTLNPAIVDIAPEGLSLSCTASGPQLGLNEPEEKFEGPLTINLELVQQDGPIAVTGTLEGTAIRQCVRCLTDFSDPLVVSLYAEFLRQPDEIAKPSVDQGRRSPRRAAQPVEPVEEAEEEDEVYLYQGDHLDLAPMVREQVILAAPMQPLCREDCLGLCPQCGQNLNDRRCACPPAPGPSPFRVLRGRQSKSGNA